MIAAETGLADHILERDVGSARHRHHERAPGGAIRVARGLEENPEIGALHHLVLVAVVEHGESRGHIGLERKLLQQPRAQRVNGLHFQASRRLQRAGEQFTRRLSQACIGMWNPGFADRRIKCGIVERDPMAECGKHALRHVGGSGFGEGDAEDLLRGHVAEQQPDHPLHEHMGFARSGIRRNERGRRRIGGARLRVAHIGRNDAGSLHHSSTPNPPAADHSLMRARSS